MLRLMHAPASGREPEPGAVARLAQAAAPLCARLEFRVETVPALPGDMMERIAAEARGADLVVVGKSDSSAWLDFLRTSVAHRVLSWGTSDVLVVPEAAATRLVPAGRRRRMAAPA